MSIPQPPPRPRRSSTLRRSLSLSRSTQRPEYESLSFDREASQQAYRAHLGRDARGMPTALPRGEEVGSGRQSLLRADREGVPVTKPPLPNRTPSGIRRNGSLRPPVSSRSHSISHENGSGSLQSGSQSVIGKGKKRALPPVPSNVPRPVPAPWQPDYKPNIPQSLINPSIEHAYASLSAPPPNMSPRRGQSSLPRQDGMAQGEISDASGTIFEDSSASSHVAYVAPSSPPLRIRPEAESQVTLRAQGRVALWSTHYLDPTLRSTLMPVRMPKQVSNVASIISSSSKAKYQSTIGAPINGIARDVKGWALGADGRFESEDGGLELSLGVINGGMGVAKGKGKVGEKKDKTARVEVISKHGGIKVDVLELDSHRNLDLQINTKHGDVLVLLPDNFLGPIQVVSPKSPAYLPAFSSLCQTTTKRQYPILHTTYIVPLSLQRAQQNSLSGETTVPAHNTRMSKDDGAVLDRLTGGHISQARRDWSKIIVKSEKGRVVFGLRESSDEEAVNSMGLKVGRIDGVKKDKKWWKK